MANTLKYTNATGPAWVDGTTGFTTTFSLQSGTGNHTFTFPDATGTVALSSDLSAYALLSGPHFTGVPTAPTAAPGANSTQLATTAYADASSTAAVENLYSTPASNSSSAFTAPLGLPSVMFNSAATVQIDATAGDSSAGWLLLVVFTAAATTITYTSIFTATGGLPLPASALINTFLAFVWDDGVSKYKRVM